MMLLIGDYLQSTGYLFLANFSKLGLLSDNIIFWVEWRIFRAYRHTAFFQLRVIFSKVICRSSPLDGVSDISGRPKFAAYAVPWNDEVKTTSACLI